MALFLREDDVARLVTWSDAVAAVDQVLRAHAAGEADNRARSRVFGTRGALNVHAGSVTADGYLGVKSYTVFPPNYHVSVWLYDRDTGKLDAVVEALHLSALRTGALGAVAARALARPAPWDVGIFGTGRQAGAALRALQAVAPLRSVRIWGRTPEKAQQFATAMVGELGIPVASAGPAAAAAADVVVTATAAAEPVLRGEWLRPGTHVNAIGANHHARRELDQAAVNRCGLWVVEDRAAAQTDAGNFLQFGGAFPWDRTVTLGEVLSARASGRQGPDQITLFNSVGVPIVDIAVAALAVRRARAGGIGGQLPL